MLMEQNKPIINKVIDFFASDVDKVIVNKACLVIIQKLENVIREIEVNMDIIKVSENTLANSYDIILENEDYTIGKVIEYILYSRLFEGENKMLNFCGFKKQHPHQDPHDHDMDWVELGHICIVGCPFTNSKERPHHRTDGLHQTATARLRLL
jgi:DNA-directed RNA polymerase subunit L